MKTIPVRVQTPPTTVHHPIADDVIKGAVRLLVQYSLINANGHQSVLSIHRLVQQVIRMELEIDQREEAVLNELLPHLHKIRHTEEGALDQATSCWKYAFRNDTLLKKYCKHLSQIAKNLEKKGRYQEVISFTSPALDHLNILKLKVTNADIEDTIFWLNIGHGWSLLTLGRLNEAKTLHEALFEETEKTYGQQHQYTLGAMNILADVLSELGQTTKATEMRRLLLERSKTITVSSESILSFKHNLAINLIKVDKLNEALEILKQITSSDTLISPGDNESTRNFLNAKLDLGIVLYRSGHYNESTAVLTSALETIKMFKIDQDVELILDLQRHLGGNLSQFGKGDEGLQLLQETLKTHNQVYGENNIYTLETLCYLGRVHSRMGNMDEALRCHQDAFKRRMETNGGKERDEIVQLAKQCMAEDKSAMGQYDEAIIMFEGVRQMFTDMYGSKNFAIIEYEISFARIHIQQGNKQKAKELLLQVQTKLNQEQTDRMDLVKDLLVSASP